MASPFPGMDPYIEARRLWSDFQHDLASEIRAQLNALIQPAYYATAVTYVAYDVIEIAQPELRTIAPDVGVWRTELRAGGRTASLVIDPPEAQSLVQMEVQTRLANVEVRQAGMDKLVTAIEILSPINKRMGRQLEQYLRKRQELLRSDVHVMEIDLLRGGERTPLERPVPPAAYYTTLARATSRPFVDVWPIQLTQRLPVLPVPLITPDPDAPLDLGALVREIYQRGAYATRIDYQQPIPPPPLDPQQKAWVDLLLSAHT